MTCLRPWSEKWMARIEFEAAWSQGLLGTTLWLLLLLSIGPTNMISAGNTAPKEGTGNYILESAGPLAPLPPPWPLQCPSHQSLRILLFLHPTPKGAHKLNDHPVCKLCGSDMELWLRKNILKAGISWEGPRHLIKLDAEGAGGGQGWGRDKIDKRCRGWVDREKSETQSILRMEKIKLDSLSFHHFTYLGPRRLWIV